MRLRFRTALSWSFWAGGVLAVAGIRIAWRVLEEEGPRPQGMTTSTDLLPRPPIP